LARSTVGADRSIPPTLTLHIGRDRSDDSESVERFDGGKARTYHLVVDGRGPVGRVELPWPQLREWLVALNVEEPPRKLLEDLGDAVRSFLTSLLKSSVQSWPSLEETLLRAEKAGKPITLQLQLGAVELFAVPWELVPLPGGYRLGQLQRCVLQYEWAPAALPRGASGRPGRVLFAWSRAAGMRAG